MVIRDVDQVADAIQRFLAQSKRPAVLEPGDDQILLGRENYVLDRHNGRLFLQAWDSRRNLNRRVTGIEQAKRGMLHLTIERFGRREGSLMLLDLGRPSAPGPRPLGSRLRFREQFRRFLLRQFPSWKVAELTAEPDLEHSLSPAYSRALVTKGNQAWAAIGAPPESSADGTLGFGLVWLDYLRQRETRRTVEGLAVFLPAAHERTTCLRVLWLNPERVRCTVFGYTEEGYEERLDLQDSGNLVTRLEPRWAPADADRDWWTRRLEAAGAEVVERASGGMSYRIHGLEFARCDGNGLKFGIDAKRPATEANWPEMLSLARHLSEIRTGQNLTRQNPLCLRNPELWLESQVRRHIEYLDPALLPNPVYGQVPSFAGIERGIIDLLAIERGGRLVVLELKASQDLHLPLQALDYWMRVRHHALAEDFGRCGYFPERRAKPQEPRLLLVAPALEFHPTTETLLRFLRPEIEVERIGLSTNWRCEFSVMFRAQGAARPGVAS